MMKSTFILTILSILFVASDIFVQADNVRSTKMIRKSTTHKGKPFILDGRDGVKYECTPLPRHHPKHPHHPHPHPHHPHPHPSKSSSTLQTSTIHHSSTRPTTSTSDDPTSSTTVTRSTITRSTVTPTSTTTTDTTSTIISTTETSVKLPIISNSDTTSSTLTSTSSTISSSTTSAPTNSPTICPSDYTEVQLGDLYIKHESNLINLSGLTIDLNILNFDKNGQKEGQTTIPASAASNDSTCSSAICCVKPNPAQCPAGYETAKRGELFDVTKKYKGNLLDLSGLTIDLNVLTLGGNGKQKGQNVQRCQAETCCYQIDQNQSLIDANGIKIDICLLTGTC